MAANDIDKGKPDPQIFLLACKKLGLKASECMVFEDAVLGVQAAKNGGFLTIGVDLYQNAKRLDKADLVINDLAILDLNKLKELAG